MLQINEIDYFYHHLHITPYSTIPFLDHPASNTTIRCTCPPARPIHTGI